MSFLTRDYFGTLHVTGLEAYVFRHINTTATSSPFTSTSWRILSFSTLFSSAGRGLIQRVVRARMIKIGCIRPEAQRAAEEGRGRGGGVGERMSQTRDDREFKQREEEKMLKEKRRGCWLGWWKGS